MANEPTPSVSMKLARKPIPLGPVAFDGHSRQFGLRKTIQMSMYATVITPNATSSAFFSIRRPISRRYSEPRKLDSGFTGVSMRRQELPYKPGVRTGFSRYAV